MRSSIVTCLVLSLLLTPGHSPAQTVDPGDEEFIILSPFVVSSDDSGYRAADTLAGTRLSSAVVDASGPMAAPAVPVSIFKRAEAVAIQFVLSHGGDKEEVRNRELYDSVGALQARMAATSGLRLEQREVRFAGGNRKLFSSSRGNTLVSFASVVVFADLADTRLVDRVKQVRDLIQETKLVGATKAMDGSVGLYVRRPEAYRGEILQKIFADLAELKEGLGDAFEIRPSGLTGRVRTRAAAEGEVELWIDYSFTIHSVRELTRPLMKG